MDEWMVGWADQRVDQRTRNRWMDGKSRWQETGRSASLLPRMGIDAGISRLDGAIEKTVRGVSPVIFLSASRSREGRE